MVMVDVDDKVGVDDEVNVDDQVYVDDGDTTMPRYVTKSVTRRLC